MHPLACRVEGGGVVVFLADVETVKPRGVV